MPERVILYVDEIGIVQVPYSGQPSYNAMMREVERLQMATPRGHYYIAKLYPAGMRG